MLDRLYKINGHEIYMPDKTGDVKIKYFSDVHSTYKFNDRKLDAILELVNSSLCDYVCIGGDIIDSTNFIRESRSEQIKLLKWLEEIAIYHKTFISCGNHDFMKRTKDGWNYDYFESFWNEVNEIPNLQISHFNPYYEDEKIIIYMPELDYKFYENAESKEDINILLSKLENDKQYRVGLCENKVKVMLIHSPYLLTDPRVMKLIKEFDIVISGHMHKGLMLPGLNSVIANNRGLVSPYLRPYPDNARGVKFLKCDGRETLLIISGGITKTSSDSFIKRNLNHCYPMDLEEIKILAKKYSIYNQ